VPNANGSTDYAEASNLLELSSRASAGDDSSLWRTVVHHWDDTVAKGDMPIWRGSPPFSKEMRYRGAGNYRWFLVRAAPAFKDSDGVLVKWFGTCTVHRCQTAELKIELKESRARFQTLQRKPYRK